MNGRDISPEERLPANQGGFTGEDFLGFFRRPADGSDSGGQMDKNNFAPRVGIAYRADSKTVVRMGAGIFYGEHDNVQGQAARFFTGPPFSICSRKIGMTEPAEPMTLPKRTAQKRVWLSWLSSRM